MTIKRLAGLVLIALGGGLFVAALSGATPEEAETGLFMLAVVLAVFGLELGAFGFFTKRPAGNTAGDTAAEGGRGSPRPRLTESDRALIETGPTQMTGEEVRHFAVLRRAWDDAHWALFDEMGLVDERGAIDHSDPESYKPFSVTTDEETACRAFFDSLSAEQRFELVALANYSRHRQTEQKGWAEAVASAREEWDAQAAGHGHFPQVPDAAVERFIAFVPDLEVLRAAVAALEAKGLMVSRRR